MPMDRVRVWGYRDSSLLPTGFQARIHPGRLDGNPPWGTGEAESALVASLIAMLESVGIEVCVGHDKDPEGYNHDVETWEEC
jgi:hypothetical protein